MRALLTLAVKNIASNYFASLPWPSLDLPQNLCSLSELAPGAGTRQRRWSGVGDEARLIRQTCASLSTLMTIPNDDAPRLVHAIEWRLT